MDQVPTPRAVPLMETSAFTFAVTGLCQVAGLAKCDPNDVAGIRTGHPVVTAQVVGAVNRAVTVLVPWVRTRRGLWNDPPFWVVVRTMSVSHVLLALGPSGMLPEKTTQSTQRGSPDSSGWGSPA